jgi:nucleoid-associated protein YgaU
MKYIVKEGDTLSAIAEEKLGLRDGWSELYRANRSVIGKDPNLIRPGMELDVPFDLIKFFRDILNTKVV